MEILTLVEPEPLLDKVPLLLVVWLPGYSVLASVSAPQDGGSEKHNDYENSYCNNYFIPCGIVVSVQHAHCCGLIASMGVTRAFSPSCCPSINLSLTSILSPSLSLTHRTFFHTHLLLDYLVHGGFLLHLMTVFQWGVAEGWGD